MTLFGGALIYLSLLGSLAGVVSLVIPLRFLGIRSRKRAGVVLCLGLAGFLAGVCLPVAETRVATARTRLDEFAPVYQFGEFHSISVAAPADRVHQAIRAVTPEEIRFLKPLMRMRFIGPPPEHRPIFDSFIAGSFVPLAEEPGREIVFGRAGGGRGSWKWTPEEFKNFHPVRAIKIVMNFRIQEVDARRCTLTTETRVYATAGDARRGFATYWRMIYPGSSLIRHMWLRAIKLRAEAPGAA